jgi:hypothetical protein
MTTLPDWLVERAALDEIPPVSRERLAQVAPAQLAEQIAAVRAASAAELAAHPPAAAVAALQERIAADRRREAERRGQRRRAAWRLGVTCAAGAAVATSLLAVRAGSREHAPPLVATSPARPASDAPPFESATRAKGPARLLVFRAVVGQAEQLAPGASIHPGDRVQLRYHPGEARYGVIASIDGAQVVTLHYPGADWSAEATALAPRLTALSHAYSLDAAPGYERFFFITSDRPIDVAYSLEALRELARRPDGDSAALALPVGQQQSSFLLRKSSPPSPAKASTP